MKGHRTFLHDIWGYRRMEVDQRHNLVQASEVIQCLLSEFSAVTDYRTLRDSLPRRLAHLLHCRCVLFYQCIGDTLQFAAGTFDDKPGWSSALLSVVHINPVSVTSSVPEACSWREQRAIARPPIHPTLVATPLIYRQRGTGVLVAIRGENEVSYPAFWQDDELPILETVAGVVALLLENTRLLERDKERIHELSLLNSISRQLNYSLYEIERLRTIVVQRTQEISTAEQCALVEVASSGNVPEWVTPVLHETVLRRFEQQRSLTPVVIERPGNNHDPFTCVCLEQLPSKMKTFFVIPLLSGRVVDKHTGPLHVVSEPVQRSAVLGYIIGGCHRAWRLRREELLLLQVLASQASAVLENIYLVAEVVEARNEARKLLHQVFEDKRFNELILESVPSGLITTDRAGCVTSLNRAAETILGYSTTEMQGQPLHTFLDRTVFSHSSDAWQTTKQIPSVALERIFKQVMASGERRHEELITGNRYGNQLVLDIDIVPLTDEGGARIGVLVTFADITSIHRLEEEKRRLDRLASLGEMAASVAHEVRNPLASIKTSVQMLLDDLVEEHTTTYGECIEGESPNEKEAWVQESIAVVLKEVERLDIIVHDLLLFARPRQLHRSKCDICEVSEQVLNMMKTQCAKMHIEVRREYEDVPALWVDMGQMEQIVLNLSMNAVQAMSEGGMLTITARVVASHRVGGASHTQQWCELAVSDTGVGMTSEQLTCLFQPFFTTKAHGMGLGLPITKRLVEDHGGTMHVESQFGVGTTFIVRLPLLSHEQEAFYMREEDSEG